MAVGTGTGSKEIYRVIFVGLHPDVSVANARLKLAALFKANPEQIDRLIATPGHVVKTALTFEIAAKYKAAIESSGGLCRLEVDSVIDVLISANLPQPPQPMPQAEEARSTSQKLIDCPTCGQKMAKTAEICPKCGAKSDWIDPRVTALTEFWRSAPALGEDALLFPERFSVHGHTEFKTRSTEALRYALIAFCIGAVFNFLDGQPFLYFLPKPTLAVLLPLFMLGKYVLYFAAVLFGGKWIFHGLMTSAARDDLQKSFRVDFSYEPPKWESNDDAFWRDVKEYVLRGSPSSAPNVANRQTPEMNVDSKKVQRIGFAGGVVVARVVARLRNLPKLVSVGGAAVVVTIVGVIAIGSHGADTRFDVPSPAADRPDKSSNLSDDSGTFVASESARAVLYGKVMDNEGQAALQLSHDVTISGNPDCGIRKQAVVDLWDKNENLAPYVGRNVQVTGTFDCSRGGYVLRFIEFSTSQANNSPTANAGQATSPSKTSLASTGPIAVNSQPDVDKTDKPNDWTPPTTGTWRCDNVTKHQKWQTWSLNSNGSVRYAIDGMEPESGLYRWVGSDELVITYAGGLAVHWGIIQASNESWLMSNGNFEVVCHR